MLACARLVCVRRPKGCAHPLTFSKAFVTQPRPPGAWPDAMPGVPALSQPARNGNVPVTKIAVNIYGGGEYFRVGVFLVIPPAHLHVRCTPMGRTCGHAGAIELTPIRLALNGPRRAHVSPVSLPYLRQPSAIQSLTRGGRSDFACLSSRTSAMGRP